MGAKQSRHRKFKLNMDVAHRVPQFLALVSEVIQAPHLYNNEDYIDEVITKYVFILCYVICYDCFY